MTNESFITRSTGGFTVLIAALILMSTAAGYGEICGKWGESEREGALDHSKLDEASGIAVSKSHPGRLYHVNDSGGGPYFYITDMEGNNTRRVKIVGFPEPGADFEDAATGRCFSSKYCLFIADIGDNARKRQSVEILVIEELGEYGEAVLPLKRLRIVYPDGPRNAEGMAVHPNGDIYVLTKEESLDESLAYPARLYRLKRDKWEGAGDAALKLEYVGEIDFTRLSSTDSVFGNIATSFDIAPGGGKFLVLTYEDAYEFNVDLSSSGLKPALQMKKGVDYNVIELVSLPQQESITYIDGGKGLLYDSEYRLFEVPLMKVRCLDAYSGEEPQLIR